MDMFYSVNLSTYDLFIIGIIGLLLIFSLAIGIERMLKIIIGNYLIVIFAIGLNLGIDVLITCLDKNIIHYSNPDKLINLLLNNKQIIILFFYFLLLIWIFYKSKLGISFGENKIVKIILSIVFAPLTVINILTTLSIVILGTKLLDAQKLVEFAENFKNNILIYKLILFFPLWLILPGLITIIFSADIKLPKPNLNFKFRKKQENENNEQED